MSPLHHAIEKHNFDIVRELLKARRNCADTRDIDGNTAFDRAVNAKDWTAAQLLIEFTSLSSIYW